MHLQLVYDLMIGVPEFDSYRIHGVAVVVDCLAPARAGPAIAMVASRCTNDDAILLVSCALGRGRGKICLTRAYGAYSSEYRLSHWIAGVRPAQVAGASLPARARLRA